ncbi:MAG TPA: TolC family protein [Cyclobacteriaceae bacterium]
MLIKISIILSILLYSYTLNGQQTDKLPLSLKDAVQLAKDKNYKILQGVQDVGISKQEFLATNSLFLPAVTLSENFMTSNDPVRVFSTKLKQGIFNESDFDPMLLNNPDNIENFNTRITIEQPIINPGGFSARKAARKNNLASENQLNRIKHRVTFNIKKWYHQLLLSSEKVKVMEQSLATNQATYELAQDQYNEGLINNSDLLAAEVRLLEVQNQLEASRNDYQNVNEYLNHILNLDETLVIVPTDSLYVRTLQESALSVEEVPGARSDLKAYKQKLEATESQLSASKNAFLPSVNAQFGYEWNDERIFGTSADNYMLGVGINWNLFNGGRNFSNIQKSKATFEKVRLQYEERVEQSNLALKKAQRQLKLSKKRLETALLALQQARESYRIRRNRYNEGLERVTDLLASESTLMNIRLNYLNDLYKYNLALFEIELLLEKNITEI